MLRSPGLALLFSQVQSRPGSAYRSEIDGLRAIAVLAVVFFHTPLGFPGGFVGVDVFFVISGYLITSLILRDLREDRFSLANFWERRIRRIFPALNVMVLATLAAGAFLLIPSDFTRLGQSSIAQALLTANIYFWRGDGQKDYFAPAADERPLLHTWSLAVEEQFYLFFPLILLGLFAFGKFRRPRPLCLLLFLAGLGSLGLAVFGLNHGLKPAAFFLLPPRAWELLLGALLAVSPPPTTRVPNQRWLCESVSWLGLAGILVPCWLYSKETPFPGLAALPPCLGTALVIWGNTRRAEETVVPTLAGRWLSWRPVVFAGLISYSLYLWHWPVLVLGKYWCLSRTGPTLLFRTELLLLAGVLALLSWRYVEIPLRKKRIAAARHTIFRFAAAATLLALLLGAGVVVFGGFPARIPAAQNVAVPKRPGLEMTIEDIQQNRLISLGAENSEIPPKILLCGDSHAYVAIPALEALCREIGVAGRAVTHSSTPPLPNFRCANCTAYDLNGESPEFFKAEVAYVKQWHIPRVVLAARWGNYQKLDADLLERDLPAAIHALREAGSEVCVLQDVPDLDVVSAPKALMRETLFGFRNDWRRTVAEHHRQNSIIYHLADEDLAATFMDPAPQFLKAGSERYLTEIDGIPIYFDGNHLTDYGSRALLLPLFRKCLAAKLKATD